MSTVIGVYETVLYGPDVPALIDFYHHVIGLKVVARPDLDGSAALRLPEGDAVLLLFNPDHTEQPGRGVPVHGTRGDGHIAFQIPPDSLSDWRDTLARHGVAVEMERGWTMGGHSLYVRDPAGNSVEFIVGSLWPR